MISSFDKDRKRKDSRRGRETWAFRFCQGELDSAGAYHGKVGWKHVKTRNPIGRRGDKESIGLSYGSQGFGSRDIG